jgi:hypothetical protein
MQQQHGALPHPHAACPKPAAAGAGALSGPAAALARTSSTGSWLHAVALEIAAEPCGLTGPMAACGTPPLPVPPCAPASAGAGGPYDAAHHAALARLARSDGGAAAAAVAAAAALPPLPRGSVDDGALLSLGSGDILGILQALESDGGAAPPAVATAAQQGVEPLDHAPHGHVPYPAAHDHCAQPAAHLQHLVRPWSLRATPAGPPARLRPRLGLAPRSGGCMPLTRASPTLHAPAGPRLRRLLRARGRLQPRRERRDARRAARTAARR